VTRIGLFPRSSDLRGRLLQALSDAAAIVCFVTVGLVSHSKGLSALGYVRDALPLLACWFGAAFVFGLYRRPTAAKLFATWIVGITVGVGVRALALGELGKGAQATFLVVALAFTLLFVLALRSGLALSPSSFRAGRLRRRRGTSR
jgi:hypothetical protein